MTVSSKLTSNGEPSPGTAPLTRDGQPLKRSLARALRREKFRALLLICPLLIFILVSFVMPIGDMLFRSVENKIVETTIPGTIKAIEAWEPNDSALPDESVYAALADDLMLAQELKTHTRLGSRLNYDQPGISSVFRKSGRRVRRLDNVAARDSFIAIDPSWGTPVAWATLRSSKAWPDLFPATAQSWQNFQAWYASEKKQPLDPANTTPHGFTFAALYHDLDSMSGPSLDALANSSNAKVAALFSRLRGQIGTIASDDFKSQFEAIDDGWVDPENWRTIKTLAPTIVDTYFLAAIDTERTLDGIALKPANERIYLLLFSRTLMMSLIITLCCILLGYPVAYLLASLPVRSSNLLMILVLLPFWTSLLVRTSAWKVLLQQQGVINDVLVWIGLIDEAGRLIMINNITGTIIAMTHILLPFMILPLFSVMKTISPSYVRAAKSMGASDTLAFWRIYFPNTVPGIGAGSILVFILSIGYYITPELVGGTTGVFISNRIAYHISFSLNWGLAAALGSILLVLVLALYWTYDRLVGIDNVKLG